MKNRRDKGAMMAINISAFPGRPVLLGATLFLALLAGLPDPPPGAAGERLHRWTTRADFEEVSGTGGGKTQMYNIDASSRPGDLMLEVPLDFGGLSGESALFLEEASTDLIYDLAAGSGTNEYLIVWKGNAREGGKLMSRSTGRDGRALREPSVVAGKPGGVTGVALAANPVDGNFLAVWSALPGAPSIFSAVIGADGKLLGKDVLISRGQGKKYAVQAAWNSRTGGYLTAWQEKRNGRYGLFALELDGAGRPSGEEITLIAGPHNRKEPRLIPTGEDGTFALAWEDYRAGNADIYFRKIASDGTPAGPEMVVTAREWDETVPSLARRGRDGAYFAVWEDRRNLMPAENSVGALYREMVSASRGVDLYGAGLDKGGRLTKGPFVVSGGPYHQSHARVLSPDSTGQFLIVWQDGRRTYENWDIYARLFNPSLFPAGEEFPVATMPDEQYRPVSAYLSGPGEALLLWASVSTGGGKHISFYTRRLDGAHPARGVLRGLRVDSDTEMPKWGKGFWNGDIPASATVAFRTRSAASKEGLAGASWSDYAGEVGAPIASPALRWLEVEIVLSSLDGKSIPVLHSFTVSYRN